MNARTCPHTPNTKRSRMPLPLCGLPLDKTPVRASALVADELLGDVTGGNIVRDGGSFFRRGKELFSQKNQPTQAQRIGQTDAWKPVLIRGAAALVGVWEGDQFADNACKFPTFSLRGYAARTRPRHFLNRSSRWAELLHSSCLTPQDLWASPAGFGFEAQQFFPEQVETMQHGHSCCCPKVA